MSNPTQDGPLEGVAVIGMSGRFPGANDVDQLWENLLAGVESITHFSPSELEPSRLEPPGIRLLPNYVRARGVLEDVDRFDAAFFGVNPREAAVMDPQHRLFLQAAWAALETAGYDPGAYEGSIGVWAGAGINTYYAENILSRRDVFDQLGPFQVMLANEKDFLTTRVSYKLNLRGPSVSVHTACSTSLVAICHAYHALVGYQCDMALAGGVGVAVPQRRGYLYQEGAIGSADGHCRPFDARAAGTVVSSGLGVVVLKRLEDARADGDFVYAVLRGVALNNDGSDKVSFTAPSVNGQADVIALAQAAAGVEPHTISYVEAHGTATPLGDPIEVAALTQAFRAGTDAKQFCAIGSVKSNFGHLDAAAGVAGFIKTVLALHNKQLPASLHFTRPNPQIDFEKSPFYVNASSRPWPAGATPRRAGVSSFGVGGTNAHVVLEEAAPEASVAASRREQLLVISAKTDQALERATERLAAHLRTPPQAELADVAWTLQTGRRAFVCRRFAVGAGAEEAADALATRDPVRVFSGRAERSDSKVVFLFPGQGAQYVGMAAELYAGEPVFARELDACAGALGPVLGLDLRSLIFAEAAQRAEAEQRLVETAIAQPALFAIELALARLWMSWGIEPAGMIGHSLGEFVAASLAGVLTREQMALVVATRGRLVQAQPRGAMLAVRVSLEALVPWLDAELVVAGLNGPELNVVSGPEPAVKALEARLSAAGVNCRMLATSHAFHSPMMDGALPAFRQLLESTPMQRPERPWVSGLTGDWITAEQATDPEYWVRQLREPVRFSDAVRRLSQDPNLSFLEVGPGHGLANLVRGHRNRPPQQTVVTSLGREPGGDARSMLQALGRLWVAGVEPEWTAVHSGERRHRVPLPTYPFEPERHWVDPPAMPTSAGAEPSAHLASIPDPVPSQPQSLERRIGQSPSVSPAERGQASVQDRLRALLSDASGHAPEAIAASQSFVELGFDSLLLTQVGAAIQKTFGRSVSLRQLLEDFPTLETLARHVQSTLDQERGSAPANQQGAAAAPATPPVPGARLGRDAQGNPAWFVPDPNRPGKYLQVKT
jgi:acyl transferase domain-containing protein